MAEPTAEQRAQISALLRKLPNDAIFKLAEAAGVFAPLEFITDRAGVSIESAFKSPVGMLSPQSLPLIWRWLMQDIAPDEAGRVVDLLAQSSLGLNVPRTDLGAAIATLRAG
ncbi:MAG: hypothetical protein PVI23_10630, partial [Maricaulaceae bacterium]